MNAPLDRSVTREIDLRMRLTSLMARVETEIYFLTLPGMTERHQGEAIVRLNAALTEARQS